MIICLCTDFEEQPGKRGTPDGVPHGSSHYFHKEDEGGGEREKRQNCAEVSGRRAEEEKSLWEKERQE